MNVCYLCWCAQTNWLASIMCQQSSTSMPLGELENLLQASSFCVLLYIHTNHRIPAAIPWLCEASSLVLTHSKQSHQKAWSIFHQNINWQIWIHKVHTLINTIMWEDGRGLLLVLEKIWDKYWILIFIVYIPPFPTPPQKKNNWDFKKEACWYCVT